MAMVFCRSCGKEIADNAPVCPHCGGVQAAAATPPEHRNFVFLVLWSLLWTVIFWVAILFLAGFVVGVMHPTNAQAMGQAVGRELSGPVLLGAVVLCGLLTYLGVLPGTRKRKA